MCRNDKKLLKYELSLDLFGKVQPFEVAQEILDEWKNITREYEEQMEEFVVLNKTYLEEYDKYDSDMKEYKTKKKEKEELNPDDPYGDENPLEEPTKPEKPEEPKAPPASPISNYQIQSVGRVYFNLTKPEPSRWNKILPDEISKRPQNLGVWWDLWDKYMKELVQLDPREDDDEDLLKLVDKEKLKWEDNDSDEKPAQVTPKLSKKSIVMTFNSIRCFYFFIFILTFILCRKKQKIKQISRRQRQRRPLKMNHLKPNLTHIK